MAGVPGQVVRLTSNPREGRGRGKKEAGGGGKGEEVLEKGERIGHVGLLDMQEGSLAQGSLLWGGCPSMRRAGE